MVAVFVDGCFWHGHDCGKNVKPKTNARAWQEKIEGNQARDGRVSHKLRQAGWTVIRIWECHLKENPNRCLVKIKKALINRDG